jgi:hypothetical protein
MRREDLTAYESQLFHHRNIGRFYTSFIKRCPHLRIRLLACVRKNPEKELRTLRRAIVHDEIVRRLQGATLVEVDALLDEFLSLAPAIPELRSKSKPTFKSLRIKPEFKAKQFPERNARPRRPNGWLKKLPFTPFELDRLYFLYENSSLRLVDMAKFFLGRNGSDLRNRYNFLYFTSVFFLFWVIISCHRISHDQKREAKVLASSKQSSSNISNSTASQEQNVAVSTAASKASYTRARNNHNKARFADYY